MIFGYDYASHQGDPDWAKLASGHDFAISKVTGEGNYVNPYAGRNLLRSHAAGLLTGAYDWVEPQDSARFGGDGARAAEDYLRVLDALAAWRPGFLLCVDWESPEWATGPLGRDVEPYMKRYFYTLRDKGPGARHGQPVFVYSARYFSEETGAAGWDWLGRDFLYWQAAPGAATGPHNMLADDSFWPATTPPWRETTIHQHQWYATRPGLVGQIDRNRYRGTRAQLAALGYRGDGATATREGEVHEPPAGKYTAYINEQGETIVALNFGGRTRRIDGVRIVDVGVSVESATAPGAIVDRSFKDEQAQPWRERGGTR